MHEISKLTSMEDKLIDIVECELERPQGDISTEELGAVIDMVKDLAEAKKNCRMEHYYRLVSEAMDPYNQRMGYTPDHNKTSWRMKEEMERPEKHSDRYPESRRGSVYDRYYDARRHYTSSMTAKDKQEMDTRASEYFHESIDAMKDIWNDADPDLRQDMKTKLVNLVNSMA